jgi:gliding motility-associated-like protein
MVVTSGTYTSDSISFYAPNAFTPNGDLLNDEFGIVTTGIDKVILRIYEGSKLIFTSSEENTCWDGTYNEGIKQGNYTYEADLYSMHDEIIKIKGELSLILPETLSKKPIEHCEGCKFKDMIDSKSGFVYESQEKICFY